MLDAISGDMGSKYLSRLRATAVRVLEYTSHVSTPFIAVFLLVHLSAPASATLGGSSVSSRTMVRAAVFFGRLIQWFLKLFGREYYQSGYSELVLLLAPLSLHAASGLMKRLISSKGGSRPVTHPLTLTGYATISLFLPIHFLVHRYYPTIEIPPISGVGPAELDYEFVKTGLNAWPWRSWLLYGGLVLSTSLHVADGLQILWTSWTGSRPWVLSNRIRRRAAMVGVLTVPALLGLYVLSREPFMAFPSLINRYRAVYLSSFLYRI